jgi:hypothetical protein
VYSGQSGRAQHRYHGGSTLGSSPHWRWFPELPVLAPREICVFVHHRRADGARKFFPRSYFWRIPVFAGKL